MTKRKQPTTPRPPKRGAAIPLGRPIDRLTPPDRERIRADVAAFLAYVRRRRAECSTWNEAVSRKRSGQCENAATVADS